MKQLAKNAVFLSLLFPLAIDCKPKKYFNPHLDTAPMPSLSAVPASAVAQALITKRVRKGDVLLSSRFGNSFMANDKLLLQVGSFDEKTASFYIYCKKGGEAFSYSFSLGYDTKSDGNEALLSALGLNRLKVERIDSKTILVKNLPLSFPAKLPNFAITGVKNIDPMGNLGCLSNPLTAPTKELAVGREFYVYRRGTQPLSLRVTEIREDGFWVSTIVPAFSTNRGSKFSLTPSFMFYDVFIQFTELPQITNDFCSRGKESNILPGLLIMRISETFYQTFSDFERSERMISPPNNIPKSFGNNILSAARSLFSLLNLRTKPKIIDTASGFAISDGKKAEFDIANIAVIDYSYGNFESFSIPYHITLNSIVFDCTRNLIHYINLEQSAPFLHPACKNK